MLPAPIGANTAALAVIYGDPPMLVIEGVRRMFWRSSETERSAGGNSFGGCRGKGRSGGLSGVKESGGTGGKDLAGCGVLAGETAACNARKKFGFG